MKQRRAVREERGRGRRGREKERDGARVRGMEIQGQGNQQKQHRRIVHCGIVLYSSSASQVQVRMFEIAKQHASICHLAAASYKTEINEKEKEKRRKNLNLRITR